MPKNRVLSTRVLLVCAAVGVATGLVSAGWAGLHVIAAAGAIPLYGLILGFHVLPGVIAQQVLRAPWVALITHAIAALIGLAFVPAMAGRYLLAAVVCLGGCLLLLTPRTRWWQWVLVALVGGSMGTALVFTAAHWFTDVLAGFILGLAWLALVITAHRFYLTATTRSEPVTV